MLRKRNDFEIIESLQKQAKHIRQLAEELKVAPSTAMRIMKRLEQELVVSYTTQGKNKVYSLKENQESRTYVLMTEHYKFLKLIQEARMRRLCNQLKEQTQGELIVLFGSQAKGIADKNSDIDLYVETQNKKLKEKLTLIADNLRIKTGRLEKESFLTQEIIENHIIIQNTERFYQVTRKNKEVY